MYIYYKHWRKMTSGLTFAMTQEMFDEIKRISDDKEISLGELVRNILQEYLNQNKNHINGGRTNEHSYTTQDRG